MSLKDDLKDTKYVYVRQLVEMLEIFVGWETANRYQMLDEREQPLAFAAEKTDGVIGGISRHFFKHFRAFNIKVYNRDQRVEYTLQFPLRFILKEMHVLNDDGQPIGHVIQRFSLFRKRFDLLDPMGRRLAYISSGFFKFWTFEIHSNQKIGTISKQWSGLMKEYYTDQDNFTVEFTNAALRVETKLILIFTCLMVDILYFEK